YNAGPAKPGIALVDEVGKIALDKGCCGARKQHIVMNVEHCTRQSDGSGWYNCKWNALVIDARKLIIGNQTNLRTYFQQATNYSLHVSRCASRLRPWTRRGAKIDN